MRIQVDVFTFLGIVFLILKVLNILNISWWIIIGLIAWQLIVIVLVLIYATIYSIVYSIFN